MSNLTISEVQLVKETWKIPNENVSGKNAQLVQIIIFALKAMDSAELIFYTFLERFPEHQQKFSAFKSKPLVELKGAPYFRSHASRIFNVFTCVVDGLGKDPDNRGIKKFIAESNLNAVCRF